MSCKNGCSALKLRRSLPPDSARLSMRGLFI